MERLTVSSTPLLSLCPLKALASFLFLALAFFFSFFCCFPFLSCFLSLSGYFVFSLSRFLFTSMFVERMEVLEYRKKFKVELSTFPDSTKTETPPKKRFLAWHVCVHLSVCAKKFVGGYLTNKLTGLNENFGVCCNWPRIEKLSQPVQVD